jgi:hypothetical protein
MSKSHKFRKRRKSSSSSAASLLASTFFFSSSRSFFFHFVFKHFCETADGRGEGFLIGAQPGRSPCLFYGFSLVRKMIFPCAHLFHASPETPPLRSGLRYSFFLPFFCFFRLFTLARGRILPRLFFCSFFYVMKLFFSFVLVVRRKGGENC